MLTRKSPGKYSSQKFNDFGLGEKASGGVYRNLNKDGSFNVKKINIPFRERTNFFHTLVSMSWMRFFAVIILCYFVINLVFAFLYHTIGLDHLTGIDGITEYDRFLEAFFFSAQTITTLGYGRVAPIGTPANIVAAVESMLGLLAFALATGLVYSRFSKPSAKIKYSSLAVMAPYQDINGFMFRVLNPHGNQLMEVEVTVALSMKREGSDLRNFFQLELERPKVVFLPAVWTIVHPVTEASPFFGLSEAEVLAKDVEIIVVIKAFDESFSQTVFSRSSFKASEIKWGHKFVYPVTREMTKILVDVGKIDETEKAELNV